MIRLSSPLAAVRLPILTALALVGCSQPDTPETQVRAALERIEHAAESRDIGDFKKAISPQYRDRDGRDRATILSLARGYFLTNQSIHLLTRIEQIEFPVPTEATAKLTVAMVGSEAEAGNAWNLAAEVHDFDVTLRLEDDQWRVTFAQWQQPHH